MADRGSLTATDLRAAASEILEAGGYRRIERARGAELPTSITRLFEDPYGIVAVAVYDTWRDLSTGWADAQAALVELISEHVGGAEAKAWEGYLVLLTPGIPGTEARIEATEIRYDTSRVRKLLATGDEIKGLADVEHALLPLLPLGPELQLDEQESVLNMLPALLSRSGIPEDAVRVVIDAFSAQQPIVECLHRYRTQT
jgi:hypothetical protein